MIDVKGLYHSYTNDSNYAITDVNFTVQKGEIFGFLGPSGAGKSTTQNILIGLLRLQTGKATINGHDVKKAASALFNEIGVSFERPNVYKKMTGLENLQFQAKMYDVETEDPMALLRMVGLEGAARKKAGGYSKGMLQRLVFARSMLNRPKIWFLDEPTSGLDPGSASVIKDIIKRKQQEGTTIFLTTHNMFIADELCDRVAFINEGQISLIDTPRHLKLEYGQKLVKVEYLENNKVEQVLLSLDKDADQLTLNHLMKTGKIQTMHSQEATLEEIFIKVTGRGLS